MKRLLSFLILFAALFCFSGISSAKAPQLKEMGGQEVDTKYYKVVIPSGWSMPAPIQNAPDNSGYTALFASMSQSPAISISVMQAPATAKQIGEMTLANMEKGGITHTPLEEKDGLQHAMLSGKGKGSIWFGENNGIVSVTIITGDNIEKADEFFSVFEPKMENLFPKKAQ